LQRWPVQVSKRNRNSDFKITMRGFVVLSGSLDQKWVQLKARFERDIASKPVIWVAAVLISGFLAFYFDSSKAAVANAHEPESVESAATYIPDGFVLVPIEVSNFESLDSLLGKFGVVDLYLPADEFRKRPSKIAERVKILRAPLNPSHFAVLVTEQESPKLAMQSGPFIVVVQPMSATSSSSGIKLEASTPANEGRSKPHVKKRSRIEIEVNKILAALLVHFWLVATAFAASEIPLVQSVDLDTESFLAFARAEDRKTLAEFLENARPQRDNLEKLMQLTQRAQGLWLSGQTSEARAVFKEISALALEDDWRDSQREAIGYSRLRLAQSAPTITEQRDWLEKLAAFVPEYRPSTEAFPPPLLSVFAEAKTSAKKNETELALADRFPQFRFILINGRKFELSPRKKIKVPAGVFRLTALSDSKPPLSETMTATELAQFRVLSSPLASGTCAAPKLSELSGTQFDSLFSENCLANDRKPLALNPTVTPAQTVAAWPTTDPAASPSISKRTWWIIGGTFLVAGLALTLSKRNEKTVEPTSRQGF
jgi:hypothetical protein